MVDSSRSADNADSGEVEVLRGEHANRTAEVRGRRGEFGLVENVDDRPGRLDGALHQFTLERVEMLGYLTLVRNVFLSQANASKYQQAEFVRAYADQAFDQFGGLLHMIDNQDAAPDADDPEAALWPDWIDSTAIATAFETGELDDACDLTRDAIAVGAEVLDLDDPKMPANYEIDHLVSHALDLCGHVRGAYRFQGPNPVVDEWQQRVSTLENKLKTLSVAATKSGGHQKRRNRRK